MKNIPMKVATKTLAFTDPTAVANDPLTGETSIVAFRASTLKNGQYGDNSYQYSKPGICFWKFLLRQTHSYTLVEWENVDYNLGNFFDGTYFAVPENGLYSFYACCRQISINYGEIRLNLNDNLHIFANRAESNNNLGFVNIDTTLKLV